MVDPVTMQAMMKAGQMITSIAPSIAQGVIGIQQSKRGKNILNNLVRPTYDIPQAQKEALGLARTMASTNQLPNQVQAEQALDQQTANALYNVNQNAVSSTDALAAITNLYGTQMSAENDLASKAAIFSQNQNQNLMNQLATYAGYQDKVFDYNVNEPFQQKLAEGQALVGAGMQNKFNAYKTINGIGAGAAGNELQQMQLKGGQQTGMQPTGNMMLDAPTANANRTLTAEDADLLARLQAIMSSQGSGIASVNTGF